MASSSSSSIGRSCRAGSATTAGARTGSSTISGPVGPRVSIASCSASAMRLPSTAVSTDGSVPLRCRSAWIRQITAQCAQADTSHQRTTSESGRTPATAA